MWRWRQRETQYYIGEYYGTDLKQTQFIFCSKHLAQDESRIFILTSTFELSKSPLNSARTDQIFTI
jgi:hypothetical protein